jgi:two-component system CheB/CheR fusion protein
LHADLEGMSQSTGIATLFVDHQLELVRFTPEATLLFRLRPTDVGRSIADFKCPLDYPELVDDLREALAGQPLRERELNGPNQARYLARVLGYGEGGSGSRRAVLSLIDVSRMHDAERLQRLIDSLPQHIAVLDERGNILQVNLAWQRFARQNGAASGTPRAASTGVGANYLGVLARSTDVNARELLTATQALLAGQRTEVRAIYPCHGPSRMRWFLMHVLPLQPNARGGDGGAVVAHHDISDWIGAAGAAQLTLLPVGQTAGAMLTEPGGAS